MYSRLSKVLKFYATVRYSLLIFGYGISHNSYKILSISLSCYLGAIYGGESSQSSGMDLDSSFVGSLGLLYRFLAKNVPVNSGFSYGVNGESITAEGIEVDDCVDTCVDNSYNYYFS